jgi:hypothetical protein
MIRKSNAAAEVRISVSALDNRVSEMIPAWLALGGDFYLDIHEP